MTEEELIARVKKCLRDLRYLSEVSAQNLDPNPVHASKDGSRAPRKGGSSYTTAFNSLTHWCELQEGAHKAVVKGPNRRPESPNEFRERIINTAEYDGLSNAEVADKEHVSESTIQKARTREADA